MGRRESRHSSKTQVGIGSMLHCLFDDCLISFLQSSPDRGWKERPEHNFFFHCHPCNRDWLRDPDGPILFWIFIIKKSRNASARSFNESESGYCSCCNGFVGDLMISKCFLLSPAHSWTFRSGSEGGFLRFVKITGVRSCIGFHIMLRKSAFRVARTMVWKLSKDLQNGRYFVDDIFKCIFMDKKVCILIRISLKFAPNRPINNMSALVQVKAWHRIGDKPFP